MQGAYGQGADGVLDYATMVNAEEIAARICAGGEVTPDEAIRLLGAGDSASLQEAAHAVTERFKPRHFDFCAIINARSGKCSEDCRWCAQSAHWKTGCETYGFVGTETCVAEARKAEANGVGRIAIVTSGRNPSSADVDAICAALAAMRANCSLSLCASLGLVSRADLEKLWAAGLRRLHCNIETAPSRFGTLCTTHTIREKLATIRTAREIGFEICSGGIIGIGETDAELVEFGFLLREIAPDSIPVNILHPIPGTPLGDTPRLPLARLLDSIAILRLINPKTPLRFAGGRRDLTDEEAARCVYVGVNAGIQGPLLTTPGSDYADDRQLAMNAGYET